MHERTLAELISEYERIRSEDGDFFDALSRVFRAMEGAGLVAVKHNGMVYRSGGIASVDEFGGPGEIPDAGDIWVAEDEGKGDA